MADTAIEERVARLEGKVNGFDARFDTLERELHTVHLRADAIDLKVDRFRDELGARLERNFQWTTGINVALWGTLLVALFFRT